MSPISQSSLEDLERRVGHAIESGDESDLTVLGYGEVSTVLLARTVDGEFACKRLPIVRVRADAEAIAGLMDEYATALRDAGIEPVETEARIVERGDGALVVYCVQRALPPESIGPRFFRGLSHAAAVREAGRVFDCIAGAVSERLAPDGQLSNWAFVDGRMLYLDVSTPFMRDDEGRERLDWKLYATTVPGPIRWYFLRQVPSIMDKYHSVRGQIVDFIANLYKERLEEFVPDLLRLANDRYAFSEPLTEAAVQAYYREDAGTYELLQRVKRSDRWFHRHILRRTYPYLLPPKIERNVR